MTRSFDHPKNVGCGHSVPVSVPCSLYIRHITGLQGVPSPVGTGQLMVIQILSHIWTVKDAEGNITPLHSSMTMLSSEQQRKGTGSLDADMSVWESEFY